MAAQPTPPQPITATLWPRRTPPVFSAAPKPAITPQPSSPAAAGDTAGSTLVHCRGCTSVFCATAQRGSQRRAVGESHPLGRVVGVEAAPRLAAQAGAAPPAHRTPVEHDEVARRHIAYASAHDVDQAGRLVPEQEREVVADPAVAIVQVSVADAARLHADQCLTGAAGRARRSCRCGPARSWRGARHLHLHSGRLRRNHPSPSQRGGAGHPPSVHGNEVDRAGRDLCRPEECADDT